jgi:hypothetical protein
VSHFNRLLKKLDTDISVTDTDYYSTLQLMFGQDARAKLLLLALKMDNDAGLVFNNYSNLIQSYSATINNITPNGSQTIIQTTINHNITTGRVINITGTDSTPDINGEFEVMSTTLNTITINKTIALSGTVGSLQTSVNQSKDIQACFNLIVDNLNNDNGAFYANYDTSDGSTDFEAVVTEINKQTKIVTVRDKLPLLFGDVILYKAIKSSVIWNPEFFGDPSTEKQVSQGTMMFENSNFSIVKLSYATDLSPSFEETEFNGSGIGDWGQFNWGGINWGGIGAPVPLRTYIPLEKQRCRFIYVKFDHAVAFEKFNIFGLSLTFRVYGTRAYK